MASYNCSQTRNKNRNVIPGIRQLTHDARSAMEPSCGSIGTGVRVIEPVGSERRVRLQVR